MVPPDAPVMRRCPRCGHLTRADRMVKGFGRDCATQLGLTGRSVDTGHEGPDLLDILREQQDEEDACDGWDRPADRPL
ncbi:hypothetical protein ACFY36_08655 [Actinoplanes sp. NPDC000266]